jgi:hypothetical protein
MFLFLGDLTRKARRFLAATASRAAPILKRIARVVGPIVGRGVSSR